MKLLQLSSCLTNSGGSAKTDRGGTADALLLKAELNEGVLQFWGQPNQEFEELLTFKRGGGCSPSQPL